MNLNKLKYSLILPSYNEYNNLKLLIPKLMDCFKVRNYEIIIVDDNSPDLTPFKLKPKFKKYKFIKFILRKKNRSLGLSIRDGIKISKSDNIIVMDSDFNHRPLDLKKMISKFEKKNCDFICGSRFIHNGYSSTFFRHHTSKLFNFYVNLITNGYLTDNLSGFFIIKKKFIRNQLNKIFYGYGDFYIRLLYLMQKKKLRITEIPLKYAPRKFGVSKSKLLKMFYSYSLETIKIVLKGKI